MGNLSTLPREQLDQTNSCIKSLLQQRQIDLEYRRESEARFRAAKDDCNRAASRQQSDENKIAELERAVESLRLQLGRAESKLKGEQDRAGAERDEAAKKCARLLAQQVQYVNEIRKRERELGRFQERVLLGRCDARSSTGRTRA